MCTVTVLRPNDSLIVTMNRDEADFRAPERPPTFLSSSVIAPIDGQSGGTWIGANSRGVVGCLLNVYGVDMPGNKLSRGRLLPELLTHGTLEAISDALGKVTPSQYGGFRLLLFSLEGGIDFIWEGVGQGSYLSLPPQPDLMVTSSSWKTDEVRHWRNDAFGTWLRDGSPFMGLLPSFHLLRPPGLEAYAPYMTRPLRSTRSITSVRLEPGNPTVSLHYWPDPAAGASPPPHTVLLPLEN